jgi:hypothetical protein
MLGSNIQQVPTARTCLSIACGREVGLPSPIPVFSPVSVSNAGPGSGPIKTSKISNTSSLVEEQCYAFNAASGAPTKAPVAATKAPVSSAPVSNAPITPKPTTTGSKSSKTTKSSQDCKEDLRH